MNLKKKWHTLGLGATLLFAVGYESPLNAYWSLATTLPYIPVANWLWNTWTTPQENPYAPLISSAAYLAPTIGATILNIHQLEDPRIKIIGALLFILPPLLQKAGIGLPPKEKIKQPSIFSTIVSSTLWEKFPNLSSINYSFLNWIGGNENDDQNRPSNLHLAYSSLQKLLLGWSCANLLINRNAGFFGFFRTTASLPVMLTCLLLSPSL